MKKVYLEPSIEMVEIQVEGSILQGSGEGTTTNGGLSNMTTTHNI